MKYEVITGDCREVLAGLPDNSFEAVVSDPPYGISFMGNSDWDGQVPGVEFWSEFLRVAKPGAHLLAFGGTRTWHRMAVAIEDAGWEYRDTMMWVYGSGFPKSHNIGKAIDKKYDPEGDPPAESEQGKPWDGWGTAMKPAHEPIIVARKKPEGTVAGNVERWGCGGLNIDGCRVGTETVRINTFDDGAKPFGNGAGHAYTGRDSTGRWPANLILDPEAGAMLDKQAGSDPSRFFYCPKASRADRNSGLPDPGHQFAHGATLRKIENAAKTGNHHPTVKPTDLMRYLCRLVTPPGGTVLDPFTGSGSTGKAAAAEGLNFFGCELSPEYADIARARIGHEANEGAA